MTKKKPASWVIVRKADNKPIHETRNPQLLEDIKKACDADEYIIYPINEYLSGLNQEIKKEANT